MVQDSTQIFDIFMDEIRCQKTMKYRGNLSTKLLFPQNDKNALTTFLHSTDEIVMQSSMRVHIVSHAYFVRHTMILLIWIETFIFKRSIIFKLRQNKNYDVLTLYYELKWKTTQF